MIPDTPFKVIAEGRIHGKIPEEVGSVAKRRDIVEEFVMEFDVGGVGVRVADVKNPAMRTALIIAAIRLEQGLRELAGADGILARSVPELLVAVLAALLKAGINPAAVDVGWRDEASEFMNGYYELLGAIRSYYTQALLTVNSDLLKYAPVFIQTTESLSTTLAEIADTARFAADIVDEDLWRAFEKVLGVVSWVLGEMAEAYGSERIKSLIGEAREAAEALGDPGLAEYIDLLESAWRLVLETLRTVSSLVGEARRTLQGACCSPDALRRAVDALEEAAVIAERADRELYKLEGRLSWEEARLQGMVESIGPFLVRGRRSVARGG